MSSIADRAKQAEADAAHRRRMRKGTKSCLPCRSRKIRCTYPTNSRTCHSCTTHGRECAEQTYQDVKNGGLDKRVGLKQRVRELETLVQQLVEKGGADAKALEDSVRNGQGDFLSPPQSTGTRSHGNETTSPAGLSTEPSIKDEDSSEAYDSLDDIDAANAADCDFQKAPLMALFDNNLFLRDDHKDSPSPADPVQMGLFSVSRHGASSRARQARVAQELRALIPQWNVLEVLLNHDQGLLSLWKLLLADQDFLGLGNIEESLREMSQSDQPVEVCKALTVLALLLQQTPETTSESSLNGKSRSDLLQKYLDTIESQLCTGDAMIGSLDGLECAVLFCRILFNAGRPRKAWLLYERALSFARLLGFHRASSWKTEPDPSIGRRREQMWWHLFIGNRGVSLLLGLPYAVLDAHVGIDANSFSGTSPNVPATNVGPFNSFYMRLGIITGRIIDRNHDSTSNSATLYGETMKIDGELHSLEVSMPKKWLSLCEEEEDLSEFMEMGLKDIFEAANAQIWHHECRIALHMPYMMKNTQYSQEAGKYEYSRAVALRSARALVRSHLRLRERPELSNVVCQVVDFQVFMAAVLLILDLLSQSKAAGVAKQLERTPDSLKDEQLVRDAYTVLDRLAKQNTHKTNIPSQATKVLDTLGHLVGGQAIPGAEHTNHRIVIPYFGAITIKPSSALTEYRREVVAYQRENGCSPPGCSPPAKNANTYLGKTVSYGNQAMPTPRSSQSVEINQPGSQANDLTFDSFVAPQPLTPGFQPNLVDPTMQAPIQIDYNSLDFSQMPPSSDMDIDAQMWSDNMWQNMLTQDLSLDLDVDWGTLPIGGTA